MPYDITTSTYDCSEQVARQITLIEAVLFKAIKPVELLNQAWTKKDKEIKAPNVLKMIRHSTRVGSRSLL
jgi:son of sevenless-like protein